MFIRQVICILCFFSWSAAHAAQVQKIVSRSHQFIVHGSANAPTTGRMLPTLANGKVELEPALLAVTAERIKTALLKELGLRDQHHAKIHLHLADIARNSDTFNVIATRYADGWQYRLLIPREVEEAHLLRAFVHTLLREFASRSGSAKEPEIPLWLVEGLSEQLAHQYAAGFVIVPERAVLQQTTRDPLREARSVLRTNAPLSFTDLCFPSTEQLQPGRLKIYQSSAQFLVAELLETPHGHRSMMNMIARLPSTWNWQTAFFESFGRSFGNMLEAEKWWAMALLDATGHHHLQSWPRLATMRKLEEVLQTPVEVRLSTNDLPVRSVLEFSKVLSEWNWETQKGILSQKIYQLEMLRMASHPTVLPLVKEYHALLSEYQSKRQSEEKHPASKKPSGDYAHVRAALKQLEILERKRRALAEQPATASKS